MRVWLKHKLTPKGDQKSRYFFMDSPNRYLNFGKYNDVPSQTPQVRPKSEISDPKASRNIPSLSYGNSPRGFFLEGKANLRTLLFLQTVC